MAEPSSPGVQAGIPARPKRSQGGYLAAILALSVALRVGVALYLGDIADAPPLLVDQVSYHSLAVRLLQGHGFSLGENWYPFTPADTPTAHWSFLYTIFLAGVYAVLGVHPLAARLAQAVIGGLLLPWLVYRLARSMRTRDAGLGTRDWIPLLAAFIAAIYLYFALYAATLMTETFFICAVLWSLDLALGLDEALGSRLPVASRAKRGEPASFDSAAIYRRAGTDRRATLLGLSLALATLLRQSILPWVAVLCLYLLWRSWQAGRLRAAVPAVAIVAAVIALFVAPFTLRNYLAYHEFLLLNSNAGYAMYSAQHPLQGTNFQEFTAAPLPDGMWGRPEPELDRELMQRGIQFVLDDPGRYALLSLSRVRAYFEFWPTPDTTLLHNLGRTLSFGVFLPFMLYGLYLALRSGTPLPSSRVVLLFMAFYTVMHILTWAMVRYRLPVDAAALPFAAVGLADLGRRAAKEIHRWHR